MKLRVTVVIVGVGLLFGARASAIDGEAELMHTAATALHYSLTDRNAIPEGIMRQARVIGVFPASPTEEPVHEGSGVLTARDSKSGVWRLPAIVTATTQLHVPTGRRPGDIILVALSPRGFDYLANAGSSLPSHVAISPGPVGWGSTVNMKVDIVGYARYRIAGVFAGIKVEKVVIGEDTAALSRMYGSGPRLSDILNGRVRNGPPIAIEWRECINSVSPGAEDRKTKFPESHTATTTEGLPASCFLRLR
jgi:lipid-binding SYLF domain-containing protein